MLTDIRNSGKTWIRSDGTNIVQYNLLTAWLNACEDRAVKVILVAQLQTGSTSIDTYEYDDPGKNVTMQLCVRLRDPASAERKWFCAPGMLGAGIVGYSSHDYYPDDCVEALRSSFVASVILSGQPWAQHWDFLPGVAAVATRLALPLSGYTQDYAVGLNPNDHRPDGASLARDYLAALALKTTTHSSGIAISVFTRNRPEIDGELGGPDTNGDGNTHWLNDCEPGFTQTPTLASNGTITDGLSIHVIPTVAWVVACTRDGACACNGDQMIPEGCGHTPLGWSFDILSTTLRAEGCRTILLGGPLDLRAGQAVRDDYFLRDRGFCPGVYRCR